MCVNRWRLRRRRGANPCGQSLREFQSTSRAARTQRHEDEACNFAEIEMRRIFAPLLKNRQQGRRVSDDSVRDENIFETSSSVTRAMLLASRAAEQQAKYENNEKNEMSNC